MRHVVKTSWYATGLQELAQEPDSTERDTRHEIRIPMSDRALAKRLGAALRHAAKLCGAEDEPF